MALDSVTPPALLAELYRGASQPERWPQFLTRLGNLFRAPTATLRIVDLGAPMVHRSYTVGFDETAARRYEQRLVRLDPFREPLNRSPPGVIRVSHEVISDRAFRRSDHYAGVFAPNGNFYAMGAHVERSGQRALQIGVHRPHRHGAFTERERLALEFFSPHLREAARLMRLLGRYEAALRQSRAALDHLGFGVWLLDDALQCRWMNAAAEEAVRDGVHGLALRAGRLTVRDTAAASRLQAALRRVRKGDAPARIASSAGGGRLLLVADPHPGADSGPGVGPGVLVFLLDPRRPLRPDTGALQRLYAFTPAEIRLVTEFLQGLDLHEASARLGISVHTARTHLKSAMQKTGTARQAELMRELLLGPASLRGTGIESG